MDLANNNFFTKPVIVVSLSLLTCCLWGSAFPAIKVGFSLFGIKSAGSKILFAGYRFFLAGILTLIIISIIEKKIVKIELKNVPAIALQGLLQTTIQYICFYIGLSNVSGSKGAIINGSNAFFAIIAAHFMLKNEKMSVKKVMGCIIGFMGVIVINLNGGGIESGFSFLGEGLVLMCSISYGISSVTLKQFSKKETPNAITAYQLIVGGALLIIIGLVAGGHVDGFTIRNGVLLLYLSLISTVSFCLWANLLKHNPVGKITIFGFTIPLFGVIMSAVFLGENVISTNTFISLLLVSLGIIIVNYSDSKR